MLQTNQVYTHIFTAGSLICPSDVAKADDEVLPGKTKTYYWTMSRSMAPKHGDADCLTHMYTSGVDTVRDTYSGLIGPMLVCKRGTLDEGKKSYQVRMQFCKILAKVKETPK